MTISAVQRGPGRTCPLHYRYGPQALNVAADDDMRDLDVLYVAGGLYGNDLALERLLSSFAEERGRKRLVFNGDFHWFDVDPAVFARIQAGVLAHVATRGNVETEICDPATAGEVGCGCAYPEWVDDDVVDRSNRILQRLRATTTAADQTALARLPMWTRAEVGGLRIAIVHGDAESLAGWGFAQEHLRDERHLASIKPWFCAAGADIFASSHTCLPVFQRLSGIGATGDGWILNNGAAGMPNFTQDPAGLVTRIALAPLPAGKARFSVRQNQVFIDALPIDLDLERAKQWFLAQWPAGSDAHASYFGRIEHGPRYRIDEASRHG